MQTLFDVINHFRIFQIQCIKTAPIRPAFYKISIIIFTKPERIFPKKSRFRFCNKWSQPNPGFHIFFCEFDWLSVSNHWEILFHQCITNHQHTFQIHHQSEKCEIFRTTVFQSIANQFFIYILIVIIPRSITCKFFFTCRRKMSEINRRELKKITPR